MGKPYNQLTENDKNCILLAYNRGEDLKEIETILGLSKGSIRRVLKENNINYKTQYKSELYPFCCDFYFPDNDLYLEINAHWTHGYHPFDSTNKDDLLLLEQWKKKNTSLN